MSTPQHIIALLKKRLEDAPLSEQEIGELQAWHAANGPDFSLLAEEDWEHLVRYAEFRGDQARLETSLQAFRVRRAEVGTGHSVATRFPEKESDGEESVTNQTTAPIIHRVHFLRRWGWAAAAILLIGGGAYLWTTSQKTEQTLVNGNKLLQADIPPGGEKAVLTLADGTKIILDNAANGNLAQQGSTQVVKLASGQIAYHVKGLSDKDILWNTMSTPAGGQYQLTLPDGTKVWLNAASSITYPAAFVSRNRQVKITGEAYLEVTKDKTKPFYVDIAGQSTIQVLGTSFNINAYGDEGKIKTTLVEGSVRVLPLNTSDVAVSSDRQPKHKGDAANAVILEPGQQAIQPLSPGTDDKRQSDRITIQSANIEQTLAWKNGFFNLNNRSIQSVLKDVERWYDIEVVYEGIPPTFRMKGEIDRGVPLSDLTRFLAQYGLLVRLEGRTLTIGGK